MNNYPHPIIALEGRPFLAIALILSIVATLSRGRSYGFISVGSRADGCWPLDARVKVGMGDKVSATAQLGNVAAKLIA